LMKSEQECARESRGVGEEHVKERDRIVKTDQEGEENVAHRKYRVKDLNLANTAGPEGSLYRSKKLYASREGERGGRGRGQGKPS